MTIESINILQIVISGNAGDLKEAIQTGVDVKGCDFFDDEPLLAYVSDIECAKILVGAGISPNSRTRDNHPSGWTGGCGWGAIEISKLLLDSGAEANFKYRFGPLLFYAQTPEMVRLLVEKGAHVNARGFRRMTPLFFARSVAVAEVLIENGANVDAKDRKRMMADEYQRQGGHTEVADFIRAKREQKLLQGMVPSDAEEQTQRQRKYI